MRQWDLLILINYLCFQVEKEVGDYRPLVLDTRKINAELDRLRASRDTLRELSQNVDVTLALGQNILTTNTGVDTTAVQSDDKVLGEYYDGVRNKLDLRLDKAVEVLNELEEYDVKRAELKGEMQDIVAELKQEKLKEMKLEKIKAQLENTQVLCRSDTLMGRVPQSPIRLISD